MYSFNTAAISTLQESCVILSAHCHPEERSASPCHPEERSVPLSSRGAKRRGICSLHVAEKSADGFGYRLHGCGGFHESHPQHRELRVPRAESDSYERTTDPYRSSGLEAAGVPSVKDRGHHDAGHRS
jgi:hypothetical protein